MKTFAVFQPFNSFYIQVIEITGLDFFQIAEKTEGCTWYECIANNKQEALDMALSSKFFKHGNKNKLLSNLDEFTN